MTEVVINTTSGEFGLSEAAYEWLISQGIPVLAYVQLQPGDPRNDDQVIFDRDLVESMSDKEQERNDVMRKLAGRYWDNWIEESRHHPLLVQLARELGDKASGPYAHLKIVTIPDDVVYQIEEYDGPEWVAEKHRTWS